MVKNLPAIVGNARDAGSILGRRKPPGEQNGNPFQQSCLENSMDREAWQATVQRVAKNWTQLSTHTHTHTHTVQFISKMRDIDFLQVVSELELTRKSRSQAYPNAGRGLQKRRQCRNLWNINVFQKLYHLCEFTVKHLTMNMKSLLLSKSINQERERNIKLSAAKTSWNLTHLGLCVPLPYLSKKERRK